MEIANTVNGDVSFQAEQSGKKLMRAEPYTFIRKIQDWLQG